MGRRLGRQDYQHFEIPDERIAEWYPENDSGRTLRIPDGMLASVSLGLTGIGNARELGGYRSSDGRTVRRGVLLRTASLAGATEEDLRTLREKYHRGSDCRRTAEADRPRHPRRQDEHLSHDHGSRQPGNYDQRTGLDG